MAKSVSPLLKPGAIASPPDSTQVWFVAIAFSILLHSVAILGFYWYRTPTMTQTQTTSEKRDRPLPVELIDIVASPSVSTVKSSPEKVVTSPSPKTIASSPTLQSPKAKTPSPVSTSRKTVQPSSTPTPQPTRTPNLSRTPKSSLSPQPSPTTQPTPTATPKPSPSPQPTPSTTPQSSPSPQPSPTAQPTPSPKPQSSPSPQPQPSPTAQPQPSPTPQPFPTPTTQPFPTPTTQTSNSFVVQVGEMRRGWSGDVVTQIAQVQQTEKQLARINYLTPLGIQLNGILRLETVIVIETNGKPTVYPEFTQVLQGNISQEQAGQLAKAILEQWQFEPTYMEGQPVAQDYTIQLTLRSLLP
ncbi:MAG: hypothetical protein SAJ72_16775 [Jaaginema sp. PMC 1080.18]|nr:hypothetical protein [Jaaginema sp. PMC 1080.18]MEC4867848.1 hypothetical protein [Jaaginema sp. PMC 1078.18]